VIRHLRYGATDLPASGGLPLPGKRHALPVRTGAGRHVELATPQTKSAAAGTELPSTAAESSAAGSKFAANSFEQRLGRLDTGEFIQLAAFVLDANITMIPGGQDDLHHFEEIGLRLVAIRIKVM
jgi:hypothetical protein